MFGHIMEFNIGDMKIRMAPLKREDMPRFIENGGMQSMSVGKYLGRNSAPVLEDEYEWFDGIRNTKDEFVWGIYIYLESSWTLIGTSGFGGVATNTMFRRGTSGFQIFEQSYWRHGIASTSHRARTMFAFDELGLSCIYSGAYTDNVGSVKALEKIGYVMTGVNRNEGMHKGKFLHHAHFELVNPEDWAWNAWWGTDKPNKQWLEARERTITALEWARTNVKYV